MLFRIAATTSCGGMSGIITTWLGLVRGVPELHAVLVSNHKNRAGRTVRVAPRPLTRSCGPRSPAAR